MEQTVNVFHKKARSQNKANKLNGATEKEMRCDVCRVNRKIKTSDSKAHKIGILSIRKSKILFIFDLFYESNDYQRYIYLSWCERTEELWKNQVQLNSLAFICIRD